MSRGNDSDSDDSLTNSLEKVGRFTLPTLSLSLDTAGYQSYISERRNKVNHLINDLTRGFSMQRALERFQPVTDILNENINLVLDAEHDDHENEEESIVDPPGVTKAKERQQPVIEDLVLPQDFNRNRSTSTTLRTPVRSRSNTQQDTFKKLYDEIKIINGASLNDDAFLRKKIKLILGLPTITDKQKSLLVQKLMSKSYFEQQQKRLNRENANMNNSDTEDSYDDSDSDEGEDEVILTVNDKKPSYHDESAQIFGCTHYQTNCKLECSVCNRWFPCKFCHDEVVKDHQLMRNETKHVLCMFCGTPQAPSQYCIEETCGNMLACYYCDKCKLFDNNAEKDIYHCDDCGICRLGLGLNQDYFHCRGCNACISIDLKNQHKCIENSTHSNCSICGEYMFSSTKPVVFMSCGHAIHQNCYDEYTRHNYKCPVCQRSIVNMDAQFRVLDTEISERPLPLPFGNWECIIKCNDCGAKSKTKYHILGLKCDNCKSYNTSQLRLIKPELKSQYDDYESSKSPKVDLRSSFVHNSLNTNFQYDQVDTSEYVADVEDADYDGDQTETIGSHFAATLNRFTNSSLSDTAQRFINDRLNLLTRKQSNSSADESMDEDYVDSFIRIRNNFDRYTSIGDAFRDWLESAKESFSVNGTDFEYPNTSAYESEPDTMIGANNSDDNFGGF
ncbi:hypothetical protein PP7435_CHR2-1065 [Komagataella phaffii CBS 7435]|uniref:Uncharacterized protein n=2 Tax=Komagataella phaffii TaxID=460519 RepID=C4R027_KOMPG|nr:Hypothetical protein PAS_chr2-1_0240 [Komagataella phaffii GS115]AOA61972.1 GQ67_00269T0 [Komagataella phaffii]CAH2448648.1 hypothetical protein BQ9382_C2-5725 [Komagataella phaffii CBS 7435]AOA67943.1 GQ68_01120T0 [Komagataella phaffii GS115]CAY68851.1 Hypothetical protein PAS_chr2-1_0240 [Komagataella phaffii GS115]CCA38742.1 hypothetical protein PP7435_CHR2-1065 [Komagataella phaffii CBS 7435]